MTMKNIDKATRDLSAFNHTHPFLFEYFKEDLNQVGIELLACVVDEFRYRFDDAHRFPVRSVRSHRFEGVRNAQDPRTEWNLLAEKTVWITFTIPPFMVVSYDLCDLFESLDVLDDFRRDDGMLFHEL
jgi:hypothetical protein